MDTRSGHFVIPHERIRTKMAIRKKDTRPTRSDRRKDEVKRKTNWNVVRRWEPTDRNVRYIYI